MIHKRRNDVIVFSDEDRLCLLQLMTRRAMSERDDKVGAARTENQAIDEETQDGLVRKWRLLPEGITLHEWQHDCLERWVCKCRGTVKVATGGGKTLFALAAAQQLQNEREPDLRLVIVVPTIPLMHQWHDEVRQGNLPPSAIALMGGGKELPPLQSVRVLICVLNSARERLPRLTLKAGWASRMLLVVDECHRANASQARRIFDTRPKYTLGLSATPEQDPDAEGIPANDAFEQGPVGQALGPVIYDFTLKQSLAAGLLTPFEVWHIGLSMSPAEAAEHSKLSREITDLRKTLQARYRKSRSRQGFIAWCQSQASRGGPAATEAGRFIGFANQRKRLLFRATARTQITLRILAESVSDPDARAIVFHESIEEIERLFLEAVEMGLTVVLEHSQLPDSLRAENIEAFRQGLARAIISAKSLVEGFNVPSADLGIIAASSSSVRQRIQSLGRMLRRKPGNRSARVLVLYVRDTEDEAIYEKADWENIVGAERNRYFLWQPTDGDEDWKKGLSESKSPPRSYRPPSSEIDVEALKTGDPYPGQPHGQDLRVDQAGNLRTEDEVLVAASREMIDAIVQKNPQRRARCTPAGHLITRVDPRGAKTADWRFLGTVELPTAQEAENVIRLRVRSSSGKRVLAREDESNRGAMRFALGPDASRDARAGEARDLLLEWIREVEVKRGKVRELFWDGSTRYWLEMDGERIAYEGSLAPLEFRQ